MAAFDLETFLKVQGLGGTGAFQALGMSFGLPSCMLNLASDAMSILPTSVLGDMQQTLLSARNKGANAATEVFKRLFILTGVLEFDTDQGVFKFISISKWFGTDNDGTQTLGNLNGVLGAFQYASTAGAQIYQNYTDIENQINSIGDCLDKFSQMQSFQSGNSADQKAALPPAEAEELFNTVYGADKTKLEETGAFIARCDNQIRSINTILAARVANPSLEPCFLDTSELNPFLENTTFIRCPIIDPGLDAGDVEDVFRLTYGPPLTVGGQYVLTSDGLYYDSQAGGLDPIFLAISGIIPPGDKWTYDYDPNLGGKGDSISIKSLNKFTENIFDPALVDDSLGMQFYYDADHFLSVIKQQRDKHVYDLSSDLQSYLGTYGEDSSIVNNQRQLIISEIANHNSKLNRRKKQIEVALKAPQIYGDASGPLFPPGEVPINDFSFLEEYNLEVDLEKQKALIFAEGEVDGMVLPIKPTFVKSPPKPPSLNYYHLNVPTIGKGSIIYTPSGTASGTVLSLTDQIVNEDLFAIYNFLDTDVLLPSSTEYQTTNCATEDMYNNAQLVSTSPQNVFFSGLAIPYFEGIVKNKSSDTAAASALGSFLRLPDTPEYRELTYSSNGFTMECWVHVPDIMDGAVGWLSATTSSLTKVVLGCENVGALSGVEALDHTGALRDLDFLENNRGTEFVRGMVCGFTRDRRITQVSSAYSNNNYDNDPASSLSFFIAPTQSRDLSSASWINNDDCQDYETFHKMKVDLSATTFGNVSSQFVLVDVTVDPALDAVSFYADGSLIATSSMGAVFGTDPFISPGLPTFKKKNSFEYSSTTVDGPETLKTGPEANPFYTPWIVGGGWTDGMYKYGNFLGGDRGGIVSGLRGHIGSLKFYSKALDKGEVSTNYKAQQGFFKKIQM
jgi:hypothetical protein